MKTDRDVPCAGEMNEPLDLARYDNDHQHGGKDKYATEGHHTNSIVAVSTDKHPLIDPTHLATEVQRQEEELKRLEREITIKSEWVSSGYNDYESDDQHEEEPKKDCVDTPCEGGAVLGEVPAIVELAIRTREDGGQAIPHVAQPKSFPIMLAVPIADDGVTLKSISELPIDTRTSLETHFTNMCSAGKLRRTCYARIEKGPYPYAKKNICVRDAINRRQGESSNGIAFRETGKACADDRCTKAKEPCTYVVMHENAPSLCMVPLPEKNRVGKAWTELEYWIRE